MSSFDIDNTCVGGNIRLYRVKAGYTVKELSNAMWRKHKLKCKPGSIKNYELGNEKIPAVMLKSIAAIVRTEMDAFYEDATACVLLDNKTLPMVEAYCMIKEPSARDALLHTARVLGKR